MMEGIKKIGFLFLSILLVSFLVGAQTTVTNMIWLLGNDMPVTIGVFISGIYQDFVRMTLTPSPPFPLPFLPVLITLSSLITYSVAWLTLKRVKIQKKYVYGIAGAVSLIFIIYLIPVAFGVDVLAGARTPAGKISLIICGYLGGLFFGSRLCKE